MDRLLIRWASPEDAEDLGVIHALGWKIAYKGIIPDEVLDNITVEKRMKYFEKALKDKKEETGVLIVEDKKIGFLTLGINRDEDLDSNYGEIWGVYLLPEYWGMGFGRILMNWGI